VSALRVGHGVYVDPWTHMEITGPQPLPTVPEAPVFRRRATPEELARLDDPAPSRIVDGIGLVPRPPRGVLTDAEVRARRGSCSGVSDFMVAETVRACGGNVSAAAALLTVPPSSLHRRVGSMLAHGLLSPDVAGMLGRGVPRRKSA
jgi:hypothetical protein